MTKKLLLLLILVIAEIAGVQAQNVPRIYASGLTAAPSATGYNLTFTLNAAATNVAIILKLNATDSTVISAGALPQGSNTVAVATGQAPSGSYTWEVQATAAAVASPVLFTNSSSPLVHFNSAYGVAVDNSFDSPGFGRIYVVSSTAGATSVSGRSTGKGIYILDAALTDVTGQGNTAYSGGVAWASTASPLRCCVAPDGQVYMCDWSSAAYGVYVMNTATPTAAFRQVFGGSRITDSYYGVTGLFQYASTKAVPGGAVASCYVLGSGANTRLYTIDNFYLNPGAVTLPGPVMTRPNNILQYNIGTSTSPWITAPSAAVFDNGATGYLEVFNNSVFAPDARGGWFISQSPNPNADTPRQPVLIHVSSAGKVDFSSGTANLVGGSVDAGMAVTYDGNRVAVCVNNDYKVYDVTYDGQNVPTLTLAYDIAGLGGQAFSMAFDRAGNLYVVTTTGILGGYSLPTANNSFITLAPSSQVLTL